MRTAPSTPAQTYRGVSSGLAKRSARNQGMRIEWLINIKYINHVQCRRTYRMMMKILEYIGVLMFTTWRIQTKGRRDEGIKGHNSTSCQGIVAAPSAP